MYQMAQTIDVKKIVFKLAWTSSGETAQKNDLLVIIKTLEIIS